MIDKNDYKHNQTTFYNLPLKNNNSKANERQLYVYNHTAYSLHTIRLDMTQVSIASCSR